MLLRYKNMVLRKIRKLFLHYFQTILHLILVYTFGSQVDTIDCHLPFPPDPFLFFTSGSFVTRCLNYCFGVRSHKLNRYAVNRPFSAVNP